MAKTISKNYTDTGVTGVTSLTVPLSILNYPADYRVKMDEPDEMRLVNVTSPLDRPETIRIARNDVSDIYRGTSIERSVQSVQKSGVSVLCQLTDIYKYSDTSVADAQEEYLPISGHIVLKFPKHEAMTASVLLDFVKRLLATLYPTGSTSDSRLSAIIRGSLKPTDM